MLYFKFCTVCNVSIIANKKYVLMYDLQLLQWLEIV